MRNDDSLAPYKIEIKEKTFSSYQLKMADLDNVPIGNLKKLATNFFDKKEYVLRYEHLQLSLWLGLKLKKFIVR